MINNKIKMFSILLIIIGSFLEIYFYFYRFTTDGINSILSIIIGISLTLFLSLLMLKRNKLIIWFIIIPIASYSIFATSAGQSFSLAELENKQITESVQENNRAEQIQEYKTEIERLDYELDQLSKQITVNTTWSRQKYGDTVEAVQTRQDNLREEKKEYQNKINILRSEQTVSIEHQKQSTNIYQFYNKLFGFNAGFLQFTLQTVLSFFIACMSPFAIILLTNKQPKEIQKRKYVKQNKFNYNPYIDKFVYYCWVPKRNGKSNKMVDKRQFVDWMRARYKNKKESILFTDQIFDKIKNVAIDKNIIDNNGIIVNNDTEEKIISILKESMKYV